MKDLQAATMANNQDPTAPIKKLSHSQLKILHNLAMRRRPDAHIFGAAQAGAFGQTIRSVEKLKLVEKGESVDQYGSYIWGGRLTLRGVRVHRLQCCLSGLKEDDIVVRSMEDAMEGVPSVDGKIPF